MAQAGPNENLPHWTGFLRRGREEESTKYTHRIRKGCHKKIIQNVNFIQKVGGGRLQNLHLKKKVCTQ